MFGGSAAHLLVSPGSTAVKTKRGGVCGKSWPDSVVQGFGNALGEHMEQWPKIS